MDLISLNITFYYLELVIALSIKDTFFFPLYISNNIILKELNIRDM